MLDLSRLANTSTLPALSEHISIGMDVETNREVALGDTARCGGLDILGQPRTGRSNLLVSLALSDIRKGYGLLFIDPHTRAINDLIAHIPSSRENDVILLDPTNKAYSFGINLLDCPDPTDPLELDNACGRVRDIFVTVWGDEKGQLGVWLDKILRNSVYLLLDNPGYTLVEVPMLLTEDTRFRNALLENVKVNTFVKDFWYDEFDRLTKRNKTEQIGLTLSRLEIFRDTTMIRNVVGQNKSTIDFYEILNGGGAQKVILLRMPTQLRSDVKPLIGTIFLSEIVNAAFGRDLLPKQDRRLFGIYCDEFQEFATPDFAKLFTQTGKYKVMPAVAHPTRLGHFKPRDPNEGATLAAANKVFFTLSVHDAKDLALDFAREPPSEIKTEPVLVISREPVLDLMRGHDNQQICEFVDRYLRPLYEQLQDARDDMEAERLIRTDYLDEGALHRIDERIDSVQQRGRHAEDILGRAVDSISRAREQTSRMYSLLETSKNLRQSLRDINRLFTALMEGRARCEGEDFSQFLIDRVRSSPLVLERFLQTLELYISIVYGDLNTPRILPTSLAITYGVWQEDEINRQIEDKYVRDRVAVYNESNSEDEARKSRELMQEREAVYGKVRNCSTWTGGAAMCAEDMFKTYLLL